MKKYIVNNLWNIFVIFNIVTSFVFGYFLSFTFPSYVIPVSFAVSAFVTVTMEKYVKSKQSEFIKEIQKDLSSS